MEFNHHSILFSLILGFTAITAPAYTLDVDGPPQHKVDLSNVDEATPQDEPISAYGNPDSYVVDGVRYNVLTSTDGYSKSGIASWYGNKFHGHLTSSREPYDMFKMTAASPDLPVPCYVKVKNLDNNREVVVKVNDRGPFHSNRLIDLSYAAANKLGIIGRGTGNVRVSAISFATSKMAALHHRYIQVGAFALRSNADQLRQKISSTIEHPVRIRETYAQNNQTLYRVEVGPLKSQDSLHEVRKTLLAHGVRDIATFMS
ncbi:MAG: septal ring lytic transglycosylase RlpA family protein [Pseudomonadota bacterium]|nr:septal ring lytic transglycosylase RlpA family protein [Pseudomonadota bacterium]